MIIYEVNLNVQTDVADQYAVWLREHIVQMLAFDGFMNAVWLEDMDTPEGERRWAVQYHLRDRASLDYYLEHHAPEMRRDGLERFPGKFTATRRILGPVMDFQ